MLKLASSIESSIKESIKASKQFRKPKTENQHFLFQPRGSPVVTGFVTALAKIEKKEKKKIEKKKNIWQQSCKLRRRSFYNWKQTGRLDQFNK